MGVSMPETFRSIIDLWASREAMAADVGANSRAVSKWWQRDSIPADWWAVVLDTERAKSAGLTAELFTRLAARDPAETAA